ncbi:MAG TPA: biotin/lipoyl-binding protein, partial [Steroidobacteraceae bacterium]|nr:biotin/lipoyl-binding protein [Steroidobacteraceae bacterium]
MSTPAATPTAAAQRDSHWHPPPHSRLGLAIITVIGLTGFSCVLAAWHLWPFTGALEHTEDAYVRGYTTVLSSQVDGYVARVWVRDFDFVQAGQVLVTIDDRTYLARVREAQAALDGA